MKKILLISVLYLFGSIAIGQDDNSRKLKLGLKVDLSVDWLKPENKKKFVSNGSGIGYGWGAQLEYSLNKTASFVTGVGIQTAVGKIGFFDASARDSVYYILNKDEEFLPFDLSKLSDSTNNLYWLRDRKYKINYITIPIALKMKTREIGYVTYYGTFGLNLGIKRKALVEDKVLVLGLEKTNTDLNLNSGASTFRSGIIIGGGMEYTIAGSTSLFFDLTYNFFFSNSLKTDDKYLQVKDNAVTSGDNIGYKAIGQKAIPGSIALTVGVLF